MNPLLEKFDTPFGTAPFDKIENQHFLPAIQEAIAQAKEEIGKIKQNPELSDFENTLVALDQAGERVDLISSIFFNLNAAETNDEIQQLAREISPLLTNFSNDILLDQELYNRVKAVYDKREQLDLDTESSMLLRKTYRSFTRNGANLPEDKKQALRELDKELAQLSLEFGEHLLKEVNTYQMVIEEEALLDGLPDHAKEAAAEAARERDLEGKWVFTLEYPSFMAFMKYAKNRQKREELFRVFASKGAKHDENDNREIVKKIARLRHERARLLGFESHAHFVLQERMAESPGKVLGFLQDLLQHAKPAAEKDLKEIEEYAQKTDGIDQLQRWDISYYSEKLKKEKYSIDDELLKPYFQLEKVIDGVFKVAGKLYGLMFRKNTDIPVYHPDVTAYEVEDEETGRHIGIFYADFFPRKGKRDGAWMTVYRGQKKINGVDLRPHVSIVCNFTKPTKSTPSLLTFNEVTTLFHEFGHALHGLLADTTYESLSGTNVYWDFVELPSQVMENWAYEKECLDLFAEHYQTGEKIPASLVERVKESARFMEGYQTVRQISFGLLDMAWHQGDPSKVEDVDTFEKEAIQETELFPKVEGSVTSCAFAHIFQGGYSSGYYSYKWAEVLDADAFEYFKQEGIFNREIADKFREFVLSKGGSEHPMTLYQKFRGKEPSPEALLRRAGLIPAKD